MRRNLHALEKQNWKRNPSFASYRYIATASDSANATGIMYLWLSIWGRVVVHWSQFQN
jgi:hypothetical protein